MHFPRFVRLRISETRIAGCLSMCNGMAFCDSMPISLSVRSINVPCWAADIAVIYSASYYDKCNDGLLDQTLI